jgi:hypothetical protein
MSIRSIDSEFRFEKLKGRLKWFNLQCFNTLSPLLLKNLSLSSIIPLFIIYRELIVVL